ncbi:MAG TPA: helix-turn-helix transcriptional regulator [Anaerolineaceae bacterium]
MSTQQLVKIRSRKLGALIYDARHANRHTPQECADAMCVSLEQYEAYEKGMQSPSLPELESLAFFLDVPLDHFWSSTSLVEQAAAAPRQSERLIKLRNRIIAAHLRMGRTKANLSMRELAVKTGISEETLKTYESGEAAIAVADLEILAGALNMRVEDFFDQSGPIGKWRSDQQVVQQFLELNPELRQFVCKPVNRPYLELASRLSELSVERLRAIAEGLLEITY